MCIRDSVLNDKIGTEPDEATIKSDKMKLYGEECARKLVNYLRKAKPEIGNNTPIYVALYNTSSDDATLPGTYFEEAYFESKTNAEFKAINEKWALFPTSTATKLDGTNATYFDRYTHYAPAHTAVCTRWGSNAIHSRSTRHSLPRNRSSKGH